MMFLKKITAVFATVCILMSQSVCIPVNAESEQKGIVIIHTNDVHCGMNSDDNTFGYAELSAYIASIESQGYETILVDAGDSIQGDIVGTVSDGEYIVDIMNETGYDVAVPGNHEYDYGMERFMYLADKAEYEYLSSNFVSLENGESVFDGYKIIEKNGIKIGFVGITTPETITSSTPAYFKNEQGEYIYGFCNGDNGKELYENVQETVDKAISDGAEYVVAIGHLGIDASSKPWTSEEVIANVSGIDVFIDGHSHSVIESNFVSDKDGQEVILNSCGTKLAYIGAVTVSDDGISAELIGKNEYSVSNDENTDEYKAFEKMSAFVKSIEDLYIADMEKVVAKSDVNLIINDMETGNRIIRHTQTNLGDLCADAYKEVLGADIGLVNGGGIRAEIEAGDITYGEIIGVHPFGNMGCVVEATGQQILDALELGAMYVPEENGGFLHISGATYEIHTYIETSVVLNENHEFVEVAGEYRVKNVLVNGEPLDLEKTYTVASHNYLLKQGGDGATMFIGTKLLKDEVMQDNQLLIDYIVKNLNGVIGEEYSQPYGQGRIVKVTEKPEEVPEQEEIVPQEPEDEENAEDNTPPADTGVTGVCSVFVVLMLALATVSKRRKN